MNKLAQFFNGMMYLSIGGSIAHAVDGQWQQAALDSPLPRQKPTKRQEAQVAAQVLLDQFIALADGLDVQNSTWDETYDTVLRLLVKGLENS